jgi:hypothetical protein
VIDEVVSTRVVRTGVGFGRSGGLRVFRGMLSISGRSICWHSSSPLIGAWPEAGRDAFLDAEGAEGAQRVAEKKKDFFPRNQGPFLGYPPQA